MQQIKRRILVTARWPVGGIRTYFRYIYSQSIFNGYEFTFLMPDSGELNSFLTEYCSNLDFEFIDSGESMKSLYSLVRQEIASDKYSLVHSHGYTAGVVTSVATLFNKKICHLMTAHDVFLPQQFSGIKGALKYRAMAWTFSKLDAIHAVSEDCKSNFLEFFPKIKEERVHTILHGVDTERFYNGLACDFRKELNLPNQVLLGFFGRFMAQKGFRYIVDAIDLLIKSDPSYRSKVRVLTFGWGAFIREEFQSIEQRGLSEQFIQMPHTDNMPAAIKGVDAVLMPSLWEACGLLGMEALTAGTPIVGTNCIGLREVLEGSPALVIQPRNPEQIALAIEELFVENKRVEFEQYALIAKERFAIKNPGLKLERLYRELIL